jgi:hypothetical protein
VTRTLTISNTGAVDLTWKLEERAPSSRASNPPAASTLGGTARAPIAARPRPATSPAVAPMADVVLDGSFESTAAGTFANPYWAQGSTNFGTVLCTTAAPPNGCGSGGGTVGPHTGSWFVWFGGTDPANPNEVGYVSQDVVLNPGVATLSFWLRIGASSGRAGDTMRVLIDSTEVFSVTAQSTNYNSYQQVMLPISSFANGATHSLRLESTVLTGGNTNFSVDDVALDVAPIPCAADMLPWVAVAPASGTVAADSGSAVSVAFNTAGLSSGVYTGTLCLISNNPLQPVASIPLTLTVDTPSITISPQGGLTTTEAGGTATFSVTLSSRPTAPVTIGLSSSNPAEGMVAPASLTFTAANWNTAQRVTITGVDDTVVDGAVAYSIITGAASSADPLYNGLDPADVSVTNSDDDKARHRFYLPLIAR